MVKIQLICLVVSHSRLVCIITSNCDHDTTITSLLYSVSNEVNHHIYEQTWQTTTKAIMTTKAEEEACRIRRDNEHRFSSDAVLQKKHL
ncbi:hypothetical protein BDC45DRAFT_499434 [Circinella umbellata]|nr:hypothetical protein BDC45DRAFT_499434 [Circinella umbellata]